MDAEGSDHSLDDQGILVITPYNAQVKAIKDALPNFRIGTVDKFQGQEAPISIYSMATSSAEGGTRSARNPRQERVASAYRRRPLRPTPILQQPARRSPNSRLSLMRRLASLRRDGRSRSRSLGRGSCPPSFGSPDGGCQRWPPALSSTPGRDPGR